MNAEPAPERPSLAAIFRVFLLIGTTAFGGGATAHIHDAIVVRKGWMSEKDLLEGMTLARIIPGTNVSNLAAFVGSRLRGHRGAAVAVAGVVVPGIAALVGLAVGYAAIAEHVETFQSALHGLTAGTVGIMASLIVTTAKPLRSSLFGLLIAGAAFVAIGLYEVNVLLVLVGLAPLASWLRRGETAP